MRNPPRSDARPSLQTVSLRLQPYSPEQLLALIEQPDRFEVLTGVPAAEGLRAFIVGPEVSPGWVAALRASSGPDPWVHGFAVVHREGRCAIGSAGFKGPPDEAGTVEIAYGIVSGFQHQGYATEAAGALVKYAFADERVRLVRAHTLPLPNASTRVLTKCGFARTGEVVDPDDGPVWRWELARKSYGPLTS